MSLKKRRSVHALILALALAPLALIAASLPAFASDLPMRKAGIWQLKTSMDEGRGPAESDFKMCIDADMERNMVMTSMLEHKRNCSKYEITKKDGAVTSQTIMTGDFMASFGVRIESTTVPPDVRQSVAIKRTINQSGTYLGADCGKLQPGEAETADGKKVLVQ